MEVRVLPQPEQPEPYRRDETLRHPLDPDLPPAMARRHWIAGVLGMTLGAGTMIAVERAGVHVLRAQRPGFVEDMMRIPADRLRRRALLYRSLAQDSLHEPGIADGFERLLRVSIDARDEGAALQAVHCFVDLDLRERLVTVAADLEAAGLARAAATARGSAR